MMSTHPVGSATDRDPYGWRAGFSRVLVNALLVLLAYEAVSFAVGAAEMIVTGWRPPDSPVSLALYAAAFYLVRWVFVLPGVLPVLVAIEVVARRVPHARALTVIVLFAPMILWDVTQSPGDPLSVEGVVLGLTALALAPVLRLPPRFPGSSDQDRGMPPANGGADAVRTR